MLTDLDTERLAVRRALVQAGHIATFGILVAAGTRRALDSLIRDGSIVKVGHGWYSFRPLDEVRHSVIAMHAFAGYRTAALSYGWPVLFTPRMPQIVVGRGRNLAAELQAAYDVHWRALDDADVDGWRTCRVRTVLDCAATLPFREALAIADSALRSTTVSRHELIDGLPTVPARWRPRAAKVIGLSDARAANPFESDLRPCALRSPACRSAPSSGSIARTGPFSRASTSPILDFGLPSRQRVSSSTRPTPQCSSATAGDTASSRPSTGRCSDSRTSRSFNARGGFGPPSSRPLPTVRIESAD